MAATVKKIPVYRTEVDNRAGALARVLADAGINMVFLVAQVIGRRYSAVFGFESMADADRATPLLRKARPAR